MTTPSIRHYTRRELQEIANQIVGARLSGRAEQLITQTTVAQNYELGAKKEIGPSIYRYGQAGGVNLALGVLCQSPVPAGTETALVPAAIYGVGTRIITVTTGAAVGLNEYAGGWMHIETGTGQGQAFRILSHPATVGAALCAFTLLDPVTTALDLTSRIGLTANPYDAAIIHPAPPTAKLIGVPVVAINTTLYGWFQTRGPAAVLTNGVVYIYQQVRPGAVAGSVAHASMTVTTGATGAAAGGGTGALPLTSAGAEGAARIMDTVANTAYDLGTLYTIVGRVMRVNATTEYSLIDLCLE